MHKIDYQDFESALSALAGFQQNRMLYVGAAGSTSDLILIGENGFLTRYKHLLKFYDRYLRGIPLFDEPMAKMAEEFKAISDSDRESARINFRDRKSIILTVADLAEEIAGLLRDYFVRSTIIQFFSTTFQSDTLFYWVENMFERQLWDELPTQSQSDIREGARGLLTGVPTGACFLFLRALEGYVRKVCADLGYSEADDRQTLGNLLGFLNQTTADRKLAQNESVKRQLNYLTYVKDEFRNPSAHPDKSFEQREAEQVFHIVIVALDRVRILGQLLAKPDALQQIDVRLEATRAEAGLSKN